MPAGNVGWANVGTDADARAGLRPTRARRDAHLARRCRLVRVRAAVCKTELAAFAAASGLQTTVAYWPTRNEHMEPHQYRSDLRRCGFRGRGSRAARVRVSTAPTPWVRARRASP